MADHMQTAATPRAAAAAPRRRAGLLVLVLAAPPVSAAAGPGAPAGSAAPAERVYVVRTSHPERRTLRLGRIVSCRLVVWADRLERRREHRPNQTREKIERPPHGFLPFRPAA